MGNDIIAPQEKNYQLFIDESGKCGKWGQVFILAKKNKEGSHLDRLSGMCLGA